MSHARSVARLLNWTSVAAGGWAMGAPSSPWAVGAAFLYPAIALLLALSGRGAYRLFKTPNDPRPTLWMALVFPVLMASVRVFEYQLVTPPALLVPALACGAALTALAAAGDRSLRRRPLRLAGVLALMTGLSASGATFANCVRDASALSEYEARLEGTGHTRRTPWLKLGPWERRAGVTTVFVPRRTYEAVELGEPVRVCLREGRLGLAWFWVSPGLACADSRPPTM